MTCFGRDNALMGAQHRGGDDEIHLSSPNEEVNAAVSAANGGLYEPFCALAALIFAVADSLYAVGIGESFYYAFVSTLAVIV